MVHVAIVCCWICIFLVSLTLLAPTANGYNASDLSLNYPAADGVNNKLLGMVLAYNMNHIDPLTLVINEYVSMCEGGFDPTVVIFTTHNWSDKLKRYLQYRGYCYRISKYINISYSVHDPSIGTALAAEHRKYMADKSDLYDIFLYHEDDIIFKYSHLTAYLAETKQLHTLLPDDGLWHNVIGFQRYRRIWFSGSGDQDIFEQELLEEVPNFRPLCIKDKPYLLVEGNTHQAVWIFTKQQIKMLHAKCGFLSQLSASREYMSSFSVFDKHLCALNKLLPGERFTTFAIWHYYQGRHVSWIPIFQSDENIRAGYHWSSNPRSRIDNIPACWHPLVKTSLLQQNETVPDKLRRKTIEYQAGAYNNIELNKYIDFEVSIDNGNDSQSESSLKESGANIRGVNGFIGSNRLVSNSVSSINGGRKDKASGRHNHHHSSSQPANSAENLSISTADALRVIWSNAVHAVLSIFN